MPVRHFDEIGKLYSEGVKPKTDEQLISEQKVGKLPTDAFPHTNQAAATDKAFNQGGPEAAENFKVSPNDTNAKKKKESAYNEERLSQPVVHEKSNIDQLTGEQADDDKGKQKLIKGSVKVAAKGTGTADINVDDKPKNKAKVVAKEALGMDTTRGATRGAVSGAKTGAKLGAVAGGIRGAVKGYAAGGGAGAVMGGAGGAVGGAVLGGGLGAGVGAGVGGVKGLTGMSDAEGLHAGNTGAERDAQRAQRKRAGLNASANPGKVAHKAKIGEKNDPAKINNSTMKENNNKSTFDRLFEDVMGEDFEEFGADAEGMADIEVGGDEGGEDLGDTVTLDLPRDVAETLHVALGDLLAGEDEIEDLGDAEELSGDEEGDDWHEESHAKLDTVPDATGKLGGKNNKVAHTPDGGTAETGNSGQEDGGKPKAAADGVAGLQASNNKVGNVQGGNAFSK